MAAQESNKTEMTTVRKASNPADPFFFPKVKLWQMSRSNEHDFCHPGGDKLLEVHYFDFNMYVYIYVYMYI